MVPFVAPPAIAQSLHWVRQFGTPSYEYASAAARDGTNGVYVGGMTMGNLVVTNLGFTDIWVAHYDIVGHQLWIRQLGTSSSDEARGAVPDGSGGVFFCGHTGGILGSQPAGSDDAWLAHFDSLGNQLWIRQLGSTNADDCYSAAPDSSGGVYLCGSTRGNFGGPNAGQQDAWVAHFDSTGAQLWVRQLGTSADDYGRAVATDGSGGVYVCGGSGGSLGGTSAGGVDAWFAHYDSAGGQLWIRQVGTGADDYAYGAAPDNSGGLYVSGTTGGSLGGTSLGADDAWLARYDSAGTQVWVRQLGTSNVDECVGAAPDDLGGVCICGETLGSLGGPSAGSSDSWLAGYDEAGNQLWVRQLGTTFGESASAVATNSPGSVFVCGATNGSLGGPLAGQVDVWLARYGPPSATLLCEPGVAGVALCPCSNPPSGPGRGCQNSSATGGATLLATGVPLVSFDSLSFSAQGELPTALSVLMQGTLEVSGGSVFGQGVRCVGGALKRLYVRTASAGAVTMPNSSSGDATISARSSALGDTILAGQSRWYSVFYRDPVVLGGCPSGSAFNTGPTMRSDWLP